MTTEQITNVLAIRCGTVVGEEDKPLVAQVSLINEDWQCVYNFFIKRFDVEDYRTEVTGITPNHIQSGKQYQIVRREVADLIRGKILVGHNMCHDLRLLGLGHPEWNQRDIALYFDDEEAEEYRSIEELAQEYLDWTEEYEAGMSYQDARALMGIYKAVEEEWEGQESSSESESSSEDEEYYDDSSSDSSY